MDNEVYTFAIKNTINEIRNVCPDITNTFMFKEDGEIVAGDEQTPEKMMVNVVNSFDGILEKADSIGGIECITLECNKGRVDVSRMDDLYFVTVTSKNADMKHVNTVTKVLIPTVLKLLEKICSTPLQNASSLPERKLKVPTIEEIKSSLEEPDEEELEEEVKEEIKAESKPEPLLSETPVNQLIIENLGGLLVPSDTVRIDSQVLSQWGELYEGKKIEEVEIETFDGKTTQCKVKPIKDSKYEGKGIIQMPEKIQLALEIKKGELVRAKPIIS